MLSSLAAHVAAIIAVPSAKSLQGAALARMLRLIFDALSRRLARGLLLIDDLTCILLVVLQRLGLEVLRGALGRLVEVQLGCFVLLLFGRLPSLLLLKIAICGALLTLETLCKWLV